MVKIMENPIEMDDFGYHYFWNHPYLLLQYLGQIIIATKLLIGHPNWIHMLGFSSIRPPKNALNKKRFGNHCNMLRMCFFFVFVL